MKTPLRFLIIDDDRIDSMLCRFMIDDAVKGVEIQNFSIPERGLEYIVNNYAETEAEKPTVLFLDINMPTWTGWEFLEKFELLSDKMKKQISIYMLSSSIDSTDIELARKNKNVTDFIVKPLTVKIVSDIIMNESLKGVNEPMPSPVIIRVK